MNYVELYKKLGDQMYKKLASTNVSAVITDNIGNETIVSLILKFDSSGIPYFIGTTANKTSDIEKELEEL